MRKALIFVLSLLPYPVLAQVPGTGYETSLLDILENILSQDHEQVLGQTRELIQRYPNSKLGQLLYADLLTARAGVLTAVGAGLGSRARLHDLTFELQQRVSAVHTPAHEGLLPANIVHMADNLPYVLLFDQSRSRLFIFHNHQGTPELAADYFFSIGLKGSGKQNSGDQRTPIGVYRVTRYIDGEELPDLYGAGAFPIDYPNTWDKRQQRTGDGIWLHGTPSNTYNRPPWSSDGCMLLSNPDFRDITRYVDPRRHTPVIVAEQVEWISSDDWRRNQQVLLQALTRWIKDRESNDHHRYIRHYSEDSFFTDGRDFNAWQGHQRWVNRNKQDVSIEFTNLGIYLYPGEQDLVLMQYDQVYSSNILNVSSPKELYWKRQQGGWKIVHDGVQELTPPQDRLAEK